MITKSDFFPDSEFPNGVSFQYPEHMVRLGNYRTSLLMENAQRAVLLGESIPSSVIAERILAEFNIDTHQLELYSGVGIWVSYDRELRAMNDEQREAHFAEAEGEPSDEFLQELAEAGFDLENIIEAVQDKSTMRNLETQMLNDLFNQE